MEQFIGQPIFNPIGLQYQDAMMQLQNENLHLELEFEEARRNCIKKQIDEIPQMSNRQLLEAIYKLLLQQ